MKRMNRSGAAAAVLALLAGAAALPAAAQTDPVGAAVDATQAAQAANARSQDRIDALDDETRALLERYRNATWQAQQLNVYAEQLEALADEQGREKASLESQLAELEVTEREVLPLMLRMLDSLEKFVALDLPFLPAERKERLDALKRLMADPAAGTAEKFRRLLEAYMVEAQYGRALDDERMELAGGKVVEVLRVGRVALFSVSLDGSEAAWYDPQAKSWQPLDRQYAAEIRKGLRVARETAAAEALVLPLPGPVTAEVAP